MYKRNSILFQTKYFRGLEMYMKINRNIEIQANKIAKILVMGELRRKNTNQNSISLFVFNSKVNQMVKIIYVGIGFLLIFSLFQIFF